MARLAWGAAHEPSQMCRKYPLSRHRICRDELVASNLLSGYNTGDHEFRWSQYIPRPVANSGYGSRGSRRPAKFPWFSILLRGDLESEMLEWGHLEPWAP